MPLFASNSWRPSAINRTLRRNPAVFGVPFVLLIVGASFALQGFTQTRYDLHDQRVSAVRMFVQDRMRMTQQLYAQVTKQAELGLSKNKKKFDIREEYFVR